MSKIVAQGQLTIIDMNDMPPIQARLTSSLPKIVALSSNGSAQIPDWSQNNLVITAELYKAGDSDDLVSTGNSGVRGIEWYLTLGQDEETNSLPDGVTPGKQGSAKFNNKITISKKLLSVDKPALKVRALVSYVYDGMVNPVPVSVEIDFGLVNNGTSGADSYSGILTNTSHTFPATPEGKIAANYSIETSALIYKGGSPIEGVTLSLKENYRLPTGMSVEVISGKPDSVRINVTKDALLDSEDTGIVYLTARGQEKKFDLAFSWSKSKSGSNGSNGTDSTSYWAVSSAAAMVKKWYAENWVIDPGSISVRGMKQTGSGNPVAYNTRFKIQLYNGGTALTESGCVSTSTADESSRSLSLSANISFTHAKITMYKAGGTSTVLDEQEIRLVQEPKKAVVMSVSSDGNTIRNGDGSITLTVNVYKDGQDITSSVPKSWTKGVSDTVLPNGTGQNYTVTADEVITSELFKCEVIVDGTTYMDSIGIYDVTDPIQTSIVSSNGEIFKNGAGTTNLTCRLWRNSEVIDEEGKKFAYCWYSMDNDGELDEAWYPITTMSISSSNKSNVVVARLTANSNGTTITLDDVTYVKKGYIIFLGGGTTHYTVSSVTKTSGKAGNVVLTTAPSSTASNTPVYLANYKTINVTNSQFDEKSTFFCEVVQ